MQTGAAGTSVYGRWDRNIVHRDLKPENIIIKKNGTPCIIDLGIARFLDMEELTKTIEPIGPCTPIYASPEQLSNNKKSIDPRTDFFCLGIISLEMFLGVHPYDPHYLNNFSIIENIMQNRYLVETNHVKKDERIVELAANTLQFQPFNRFRNYQIFRLFLEKHLQK